MRKVVHLLFNHQFATDMFTVRIGLDTREGVCHCLNPRKKHFNHNSAALFFGCLLRVSLHAIMRA